MGMRAGARRYDFTEEARVSYCPVTMPDVHTMDQTIRPSITIIHTISAGTMKEQRTPLNKSHTIRTTRMVTIPPMSQVAIPVVMKTSGLFYIEPKLLVQSRYHVRKENGIYDARPNVKFELVLANFSRVRIGLREFLEDTEGHEDHLRETEPTHDTLSVPEKVSTKLDVVLNLPFTKATVNDAGQSRFARQRLGRLGTESGPSGRTKSANGERNHQIHSRKTILVVAIELLPVCETIPERNFPRISDAKPNQHCYPGPGCRHSLLRGIKHN